MRYPLGCTLAVWYLRTGTAYQSFIAVISEPDDIGSAPQVIFKFKSIFSTWALPAKLLPLGESQAILYKLDETNEDLRSVTYGRIIIMAKKISQGPSPSKAGIELYSPTYFGACALGGIVSCGPTHTGIFMSTQYSLISGQDY